MNETKKAILKMINELIEKFEDGLLMDYEAAEIISEILNVLNIEDEKTIEKVEKIIKLYILSEFYTDKSKTELINILVYFYVE